MNQTERSNDVFLLHVTCKIYVIYVARFVFLLQLFKFDRGKKQLLTRACTILSKAVPHALLPKKPATTKYFGSRALRTFVQLSIVHISHEFYVMPVHKCQMSESINVKMFVGEHCICVVFLSLVTGCDTAHSHVLYRVS